MGPPVSLRFRSRVLTLAGSFLVGLGACGGEQKPEAGAPAKAPARASEIPAGIRIEVEIDGELAPPIDSALLRRVEPDFRSGARRSWKIERLVGPAAARPKNVLEVEDAEGVATVFPPGARRMWEPVLSLNRRGDLLLALRAREDAARAFHGRGGNRGRPGSPRRQIRDVAKLKLYERERVRASASDKRRRGGEAAMEVFVDGERTASWRASDLSTVEKLPAVAGSGGRRAAEAWSLHTIVRTLIGPDGVVSAVQGRDGGALELDPADWSDADKVPVLWLNRRGEFKFEWHTPSGRRLPGAGVRGVSQIHLRSGPT